jgi:hypothetical protein
MRRVATYCLGNNCLVLLVQFRKPSAGNGDAKRPGFVMKTCLPPSVVPHEADVACLPCIGVGSASRANEPIMKPAIQDAHWDLLLSIAEETLDIKTFELSGKASIDFRVISVENLARALEAAYDAGLMVGYEVGSKEHSSVASTSGSRADA